MMSFLGLKPSTAFLTAVSIVSTNIPFAVFAGPPMMGEEKESLPASGVRAAPLPVLVDKISEETKKRFEEDKRESLPDEEEKESEKESEGQGSSTEVTPYGWYNPWGYIPSFGAAAPDKEESQEPHPAEVKALSLHGVPDDIAFARNLSPEAWAELKAVFEEAKRTELPDEEESGEESSYFSWVPTLNPLTLGQSCTQWLAEQMSTQGEAVVCLFEGQARVFLTFNDSSMESLRAMYGHLSGQLDRGIDFYTPVRDYMTAESLWCLDDLTPQENIERILAHPLVAPLYRAYIEDMSVAIENCIWNIARVGGEEAGDILANHLGMTQQLSSCLVNLTGRKLVSVSGHATLAFVAPPLAVIQMLKLNFISNLAASLFSDTEGLVEKVVEQQCGKAVEIVARKIREQGITRQVLGRASSEIKRAKRIAHKKMLDHLYDFVANQLGNSSEYEGGYIPSLVLQLPPQMRKAAITYAIETFLTRLPEEVSGRYALLIEMQNDLQIQIAEAEKVLAGVRNLQTEQGIKKLLRNSIRRSLGSLREDLKGMGYSRGAEHVLLLPDEERGSSSGRIAKALTTVNQLDSRASQGLFDVIKRTCVPIIPESVREAGDQMARHVNSTMGGVASAVVVNQLVESNRGMISGPIQQILLPSEDTNSDALEKAGWTVSLLGDVVKPAFEAAGHHAALLTVEALNKQIPPICSYSFKDLTQSEIKESRRLKWGRRALTVGQFLYEGGQFCYQPALALCLAMTLFYLVSLIFG